jgi:DNA-directed RNA polymerase specialized sigma subunit
MRKWNCLQRKEDILLLAQCLAELPRLQKKLLSLYYLENIPLGDIAVGCGLSEAQTGEMVVGSIDLLRRYFCNIHRRSISQSSCQRDVSKRGLGKSHLN